MKTETAIDKLDQYFVLMDAATVGEQSVFANNQAKEWHESILTYAMRKYRAASYHLENVTRLIVERRADSPCTDILDDVAFPHDKIVEASVICRYDADTFIYELAAFLEAIKSSLDFLATASCVYLRGVTADSIRTLIRLAENPQDNRRGIGFEATKRHLAWLKQLRDYRHHLVHRMVICTSAGHEVHRKGAIVRAIQHPVVVPESTPS